MLTINKEMKKEGFTHTLTSKRKSVCGFTIVEVIVVIAIVAVLTVIIFPSINNIRAKNRDAERVSDIATIQLALSFYKNKIGQYPMSLEELFDEGYITNETFLDPNGEPYTYVALNRGSGVCTYYHLGTTLEMASGQIDMADTFSSEVEPTTNNYSYCDDSITGSILTPPNLINRHYNVRP